MAATLMLQRVFDKLWGPIMGWIHSPHSGKTELLESYEALSEHEKALLTQDVSRAFHRAHGGDTVTAFRYKDRPSSMGGMSVTSKEPTYLGRDKYTAYVVHSSDILAHWAQEDLPLGGNAFGHEEEMIFKPNANPKAIEP